MKLGESSGLGGAFVGSKVTHRKEALKRCSKPSPDVTVSLPAALCHLGSDT